MNETPLMLLIRAHYRALDKDAGPWTEVRVRSLCNAMQITEPELAAFLRINYKRLRDSCITGNFPSWLRLLLSMLEGWVKRTRLGDAETKIFPTHLF